MWVGAWKWFHHVHYLYQSQQFWRAAWPQHTGQLKIACSCKMGLYNTDEHQWVPASAKTRDRLLRIVNTSLIHE